MKDLNHKIVLVTRSISQGLREVESIDAELVGSTATIVCGLEEAEQLINELGEELNNAVLAYDQLREACHSIIPANRVKIKDNIVGIDTELVEMNRRLEDRIENLTEYLPDNIETVFRDVDAVYTKTIKGDACSDDIDPDVVRVLGVVRDLLASVVMFNKL